MYIEDIFLASEMNQYYKNTVRPGRKLDVRRILRQEPAFFQIITKRDTSSGRIVWRLSPDLLKRSSDVILEDDIFEVRCIFGSMPSRPMEEDPCAKTRSDLEASC